jgi:hypothetical protein
MAVKPDCTARQSAPHYNHFAICSCRRARQTEDGVAPLLETAACIDQIERHQTAQGDAQLIEGQAPYFSQILNLSGDNQWKKSIGFL